jgi:hypothetical protein
MNVYQQCQRRRRKKRKILRLNFLKYFVNTLLIAGVADTAEKFISGDKF